MTEEKKIPEIVFAPGCFDSFEGTQEELDELVAEIQRMAESGELFEKSQPLDLEDMDEDEAEALENLISMDEKSIKRNLQ